jgi:ABC-type multidrug transport system fused ATPase/permease subunit
LYDPQSGTVRADGVDIKHLDVDGWRSRIAAVFQDFIRYELPLRENVAPLGAPDDEVVRALERAQAGDLAGLDRVLSKLYENGTDLSGGQWQRVALARAMCAVQLGAGVVILDEPTAQLDPAGTRLVGEALEALAEAGTSLLIAEHKTDLLDRLCHRVVLIDGGRIIRDGATADVLGDPSLEGLGVEPPARVRLARDMAAAGIGRGVIERALA